jgi:hypothetical protein
MAEEIHCTLSLKNMYKNNAFFGKKIVAKKTLLDFPRCRRLKVTCNF